MTDSLWPQGLQHIRLPCHSPSPGVCSNSCPLSGWCLPTISSFLVPSPPAFNLSQHQGLFQWVGSLHQVAKVLDLQLQHQSFQQISNLLISSRIEWFDLLQSKGFSRVFSNTTVESISSLVLSILYGPTLTSVHDYWKNHGFGCMDLCQQSDVFSF